MSNILLNKCSARIIKNTLRWNFNFYFRKKAFPLITAFRLTNKCNLQCAMCGIWQIPEKKVFAFDKFRKIIRELGELGCCYVTLSGGEPLLVPNITDYVREAKRQDIFTNLVTNGLLIDAELTKGFAAARLDTISLSIDGLKETHDRIRGFAGSFEAALGALDFLERLAPEVRIVVNTVISPWNIDDLKELHGLLSKRRLFFKFQPIYHHPDYEKQKKETWAVTPEFMAKLEGLIKYLLKQKNVVSSAYFLRAIPDYFKKDLRGRIFSGPCFSPYYYCEFMEDGSISPCVEGMGWQNGLNMDNCALATFLESQVYKDKIEQMSDCRRCGEILTICYAEPKFLLPLGNLVYAKFNC
ncbi:MAG: radical SAM protein [Candidatus Omnitrophota bacterium]|nr:radical SAM protein [Candidatus Omnitrophota bacterium]